MALSTTNIESSEQLADRVYQTLQRLDVSELRGIKCEGRGATVVLRGQLTSPMLKKKAQTMAGKVHGVREVVDRIELQQVRHA